MKTIHSRNRHRQTTTVMVAVVLLLTGIAFTGSAQTVTFARINDAVDGRCYDPATTAPDITNPNRLLIGIHSNVSAGTFDYNAGCYASDTGLTLTTDTMSFYVEAPVGYYISKITFTQTGTTSGSRGGRGFRSANWVVADRSYPVRATSDGWVGSIDLSLERRTLIPVSITTYLAAFGGSVMSGAASASNPAVLVELFPLQ